MSLTTLTHPDDCITLPYYNDFDNLEDLSKWKFTNFGENQWHVGPLGNNTRDEQGHITQGNGIFISNDDGETNNYDKDVKIIDIPIMDRYSNGSYVVKDKVNNSYIEIDTLSKENFEGLEYIEEKAPVQAQLSFDMLHKESLKSVDDQMVIINNFLDNIEGK